RCGIASRATSVDRILANRLRLSVLTNQRSHEREAEQAPCAQVGGRVLRIRQPDLEPMQRFVQMPTQPQKVVQRTGTAQDRRPVASFRRSCEHGADVAKLRVDPPQPLGLVSRPKVEFAALRQLGAVSGLPSLNYTEIAALSQTVKGVLPYRLQETV